MSQKITREFLKISWLLLLLSLLLGCTQLQAPAATMPVSEPVVVTAAPPTPSSLPISSDVTGKEETLVSLYTRANPAVINVTIYGELQGQIMPLGGGSGFVLDDAGRIITNDHVFNEAEQVEVTFADGTILTAEIIGQDPNSDLAVLQVEKLPSGVVPLPLGNIDELAVGQSVVAIGNPFGLEGTLTEGIISALGRTIPSLTPFSIPQSIQTDAAINPGNSGGPLLNLQGQVIGVNAQIETGSDSRANSGVGFAIPVSILRQVVPELIANGRYPWPWLGVRGGSVTPTLVEAMELPIDNGAYLVEVIDGGPAGRSKLRGAEETVSINGRQALVGGDVITAVDGRSVRSFDDLLIYIALETRPDQEIIVTILRDGETRDVNVRLEARPDSLDA